MLTIRKPANFILIELYNMFMIGNNCNQNNLLRQTNTNLYLLTFIIWKCSMLIQYIGKLILENDITIKISVQINYNM